MLWPVWFLTRFLVPVILLGGIAGGILYVRLLNGPISLKLIAHPIARAIAADLPGFEVTVDDASVVIAEGRGLEFRLSHVRLLDARGVTVAQAPDAAVTLSTSALWTGRIAPSRIVLIEPSLVVQHSRERGLSLTFDEAPGQRAAGEAPAHESTAAVQGDLGTVLGTMLSQVSQSAGAASFIRGLGVRNATLTIESAGGLRTMLRIREADIGVDRRRQGSLLGANLSIESARGPWQLTLVASREDATSAVTLDVRVTDLVPSAIASAGPLLAPLAVVDLPVRGTAAIRLGGGGAAESAVVELDVGRGALAPGWRGAARKPREGGRISMRYEPATRRLGIATSRIASGASWASFSGGITLAGEPGQPWGIDLASTEGQLADEDLGIAARPLDAVRVRGSYDPATGNFDLAEASLKAAGGEIAMSGLLPAKGSAARLNLQGRMSPMPVDTLKLLWPSVVAPHARRWIGRQVQQGRLTSGTFLVEEVVTPAERAAGGTDGVRLALAIEGSGVRLQPKPGFALVEAPRVLVRLDGNTLEVASPEATIHTSAQRRLPIRGIRMISTDVTSAAAVGDLTFRAQGALPPALDLAEQQAARNGRTLVLPGEGLDGRVDAQVRILVPLGDDLTAEDTRLDIRGRVTDGRARNVIGSWDVSGATLAFEVTDQQLDTRGDILVAGVPAKVALKRIFAAPEGEQPPIHVSANLDTADRTTLGLDVNEFVLGETPVEILVSPRPQQDAQVQVRVNLTNAELMIEPLSWRKAPGRPATLQFEIARPGKQRTELQAFRIVGEDISLNGSLVLDGRNRVREFNFPELVLHVVSRLSLSGSLRADNVWDVTVRGQTLDGRDFFQSLFSVSQVRPRPLPPRKDQSGLDLKVEIDNVLGHHDLSLKGLRMAMQNRGGRPVSMQARGVLEGAARSAGTPLEVTISQTAREPRRLRAQSNDAGQAFRLIGLFPNMLGGSMTLNVNLDGSGTADKTGRLYVRQFAILGDPVSAEAPGALEQGSRGARRVERSRLDFDEMNAPFQLGGGQVSILDADLRGQVLGVVITGKADYRAQNVDFKGTYVPLQGINSAIGYIPILGVLLAGPRGEGVIGMNFEIRGAMSRPQILVNPVSILPGILREMMRGASPDTSITPPAGDVAPAPTAQPGKTPSPKRPQVRSTGPGQTSSRSATSGTNPPQVEADGASGWSTSPPRLAPQRPAIKPQ